MKNMKEFKFVAFTCPLERLLMFTIPLGIILLILCFTVDVFEYFWYIFIAIFICNISLYLIFLKYVRITFSPSNEICIYLNGKKKYIGNVNSLKYVKGANLTNDSAEGCLEIVFADRCFIFSIFEKRGLIADKISKHIELLRYMASVYELEEGASKTKFLKESIIYNNPTYTGISINEGYRKSEH